MNHQIPGELVTIKLSQFDTISHMTDWLRTRLIKELEALKGVDQPTYGDDDYVRGRNASNYDANQRIEDLIEKLL